MLNNIFKNHQLFFTNYLNPLHIDIMAYSLASYMKYEILQQNVNFELKSNNWERGK